jgi:molybdopterin-binding protein
VAETMESSRIEIGFDGGQIMSALVTLESADALQRAVKAGSEGTLVLDAQDGSYTVVLGRIVYVKHFARGAEVGFGQQ